MKVRKAVFPAAGFGTRFLPASKAVPKEMFPLVDKPLIQYTVEEAGGSGIEDIIIVTSRNKQAIEDHFDTNSELNLLLKKKHKKDEGLEQLEALINRLRFSYTRQRNPRGLGHAVLCARSLVAGEPFAVLLGDDIIDAKVPATKQMIDVFEERGATVVAVQRVPRRVAHLYGIIKGKKVGPRLYKVTDLVEKPSDPPSNLAIIGRYIFTPEIFDAIEHTKPGKGNEIQLTDAIKRLSSTQDVYAYEFEGDRYDAGDKAGFIKANILLSLKDAVLRKEIKGLLKNLNR